TGTHVIVSTPEASRDSTSGIATVNPVGAAAPFGPTALHDAPPPSVSSAPGYRTRFGRDGSLIMSVRSALLTTGSAAKKPSGSELTAGSSKSTTRHAGSKMRRLRSCRQLGSVAESHVSA